MFSDLRGFTSFAETLEPASASSASLNRYLTAMSEAILDHGGTLVAYMGDGIMAVFGAPLAQDDHADRALAAARDMLDRLEGFNDWLREEGLHEGFKMGIGLNSGPGDVRQRRLRAPPGVHGARRHDEHRRAPGGHDQGHAATSSTSPTRPAAASAQPADDLVEVGEFEVRGRKAKVKLWSLREEPAPAGDVPGAPLPGTVEASP